MSTKDTTTISKLFYILKFQKKEIYSIYFFAIFSGLVQLSLPLGIQSIIGFVLGGSISTSLILLIAFVILGVFFNGMLQVHQLKIIERIQQQLFTRYSFLYAYTIPRLDMMDINKYYLPELTNRFFDTIVLQKSISKLLLDIPAASIQILFGLLLLSFYHPVFIFFGILLLSVLFIILQFSSRQGMKTSIQESDYKYKVAGYLQEMARFVINIKFTKDKDFYLNKTDHFVKGYLKARTAHFKVLLFQYWTLITFKLLIVAAMLIVGAYLLVTQQLNIGQFIATEIVILTVIDSIEKLIVNFDKVYDVLTSVEKINKLTDKEKETGGTMIFSSYGQGVTVNVQNLTFGFYEEHTVLQSVNLMVNRSEKVCITGPHGSGKSTLLKVISGIYQPNNGSILINEIPNNNYSISSLRSAIGLFTGSQGIFEGTIKENIFMSQANTDTSELYKLASIIGLTRFIESNRDGYEMFLQPTGHHLPSRIVKKILLMRVMISNPPLLLLEEPCLGLEPEYQESIIHYLMNELKHTTVIIISNEPAFMDKCNRVVTMEKGRISNIKTN